MAYLVVDNFSGGVDRSRPRYIGPPGTVWSGINGHLTRGGDFEKRKDFTAFAALPTGQTFGLAKTSNGLYVFGSNVAPSMPAGVSYQRLAHPTGAADMSAIKSVDLFNGNLYVIAEYANGDIRHFYNGSNVADWNAGGTNPTGYGSIVRTHKRKIYSPVNSILWFSELDTPNNFDTAATGSGFQNMQNHSSGSDVVTAMTSYQGNLAVFSRRVVQIWNMDNDDALNALVQLIDETGTRAPKSVTGFGDIDAFYLSDSGVRSLRARNVNNTAGVNDVGTAIDPLIREWIGTLTEAQITAACAVVEPVDGRFWLAIGGRIFVFTYFPSKKISAWSWYEPGVTFTDFVTINDRVYGRAGDTIYLYGGSDNAQYVQTFDTTVALPFLSGNKPGTFKNLRGVDIAADGTWNCKILVNPNDENEYVDVGDLTDVTFPEEGIGASVHTTHIAPVLLNSTAGYASLSQVAIFYDGAETKV